MQEIDKKAKKDFERQYKVLWYERKRRKWPFILYGVLFVLLVAGFIVAGTEAGRRKAVEIAVKAALSGVNSDFDNKDKAPTKPLEKNDTLNETPTPVPAEEDTSEDDNVDWVVKANVEEDQTEIIGFTKDGDGNFVPFPAVVKPDVIHEPDANVINVLLIGAENLKNQEFGRSDSMMIASVNVSEGTFKIISLMRDMFVRIPEIEDEVTYGKLNASYAHGGPELLMDTVALNFGIQCDSYVVVDFDAFEKIIDLMGGVEISLTSAEAKYLNTTNYISKKEYRNVVSGKQILNGNQALGYCRVRKVAASNGMQSDNGRVYRQGLVVNSLFNKMQSADLFKLWSIYTTAIDYVIIPADQKEQIEKMCTECINIYLNNRTKGTNMTLERSKIPIKDHYKALDFYRAADPSLQRSEVVVWDEENIKYIYDFLY
ncbi:MAG: LCP family protein [Lachnospiraceae bacterium]|nr:LCP family protein [Lachnospiraceae bacterium]